MKPHDLGYKNYEEALILNFDNFPKEIRDLLISVGIKPKVNSNEVSN